MSDDATKNTDESLSGDLPLKEGATVSDADASNVTGGGLLEGEQIATRPPLATNSLLGSSTLAGRAIGRAIA